MYKRIKKTNQVGRHKLKPAKEVNSDHSTMTIYCGQYHSTIGDECYLNDGDSIVPPMIITISWDSFISGSNPRFPPGEDSNMKPKSIIIGKETIMLSSTFLEDNRKERNCGISYQSSRF